MVDFESFILERLESNTSQPGTPDSDDSISCFSDSDDSSDDEVLVRRRASRRRWPSIRRFRRNQLREAGVGWGCECIKCLEAGEVKTVTTFREFDDVKPCRIPPNAELFFSLCGRDVYAFSLKDRKFGALKGI